MKDWLILGCIGIIAVLAFRERSQWTSPQPVPPPASAVPAESPVPEPEVAPVPPPPTVAALLPAPDESAKAELANLVAQSQRSALAKYPALGNADSEINIRFNFRYKRMLADYSPRLQDPNWPLQLADECAQAADSRPGATHLATPPLVATASAASMPPTNAVQPAVASAPSSYPPRPAPAPAQTLVFHPAAASAPQTPLAVNPAPVAAPKPPGELPFITLDAVNQSSGNSYTYNWGSYYGWYDISFRQSVGISIGLRNMSRAPAAVNLRWIFFARNTSNNARFVFAASGKELDLTPGQNAAVAADSPLIHSREVNYGWVGDRYLTGSKYEGWLVQLLERGSHRLIRQTGSTSYLEDLAKRSDFSSLIDDYRTKMHGQGGDGL